jgi:hypothetical protein
VDNSAPMSDPQDSTYRSQFGVQTTGTTSRSSLAGFARSPECVDKSVTENGHVRGGSHS